MSLGIAKLVRKHVGFHGQTAYAGARVDTGLTQALLCLNSRGMKKGGWQVFGLDSHPCYLGSHLGLQLGNLVWTLLRCSHSGCNG